MVVRTCEQQRSQSRRVVHVPHRARVTLHARHLLPRVQAEHMHGVIAAHRQHEPLAAVHRHTPVVVRVAQHRPSVHSLHVLVAPVLVHNGVSLVRQRHHVVVVAEERDVRHAEGDVRVPLVLVDAHFLLLLRLQRYVVDEGHVAFRD